jgi:rod shape-determining protein MreD
MNRLFLINTLRFVLLVITQALVLKNVNLFGLVNPMVYPLFVLLLPFAMPRWQLLILGFLSGLAVDLFTGTYGMHAAATTFLAFLRPFLITVITTGKSELDVEPNVRIQGLGWFFLYVAIACLFHHLVYFYVEIGTFWNLFYTLLKVILSTLCSTILILLLEIIFRSGKKRKFA